MANIAASTIVLYCKRDGNYFDLQHKRKNALQMGIMSFSYFALERDSASKFSHCFYFHDLSWTLNSILEMEILI